MNKVKAGFFSFTEVTDPNEHRVASARPPARAVPVARHRLRTTMGLDPGLCGRASSRRRSAESGPLHDAVPDDRAAGRDAR